MKRSVLTPSLKMLLQALTTTYGASHFRYITELRGNYWCGNQQVRKATFALALNLGLIAELHVNNPRRWGPTEEATFLLADPHYQPKCLREAHT